MTETQFVTQLGVDSNLWIQGTKVEDRKLDLTIVDHANQLAWNGELSDLVAKDFYHQYGLTAEDYWKTILTQLQTPSENFLFTVREDKFYIEKVGLNQVKLTYAKLQLQKKDLKEALISTTMALLDIQNKLRSKNELLETSIADVNRDLSVLSEQFEKVTDDTIVKEELLLSNFLDLLNAKKEKILQLQSELTDKGSVEPGSGDSVYDDDTEVDEENEEPTATASSAMGTKRSKKTDVSDNFDDVMDL
ncbi:Hypothetical predicted protein [Cloeon dipterum]|uniref:DNA repair protein XRCC4 n=1 Tax=Cloeon dipterum TaxID=197152 RepID=A0A8S1CR95_9INSE|nr:Hypothetical predicted protein [Cloeon dipterum]